jgi:phosphoserine aminotransferase
MISFYPGPSRVYDEIPKYVQDAAKLGVMSINHRSDEFVAMSEKTISLLKKKLGIPSGYTILYTTSATECWEIIAQSLISEKSYHFYNGAFGQKWFEYTKRLRPGAVALPFDKEEKLPVSKTPLDKDSIICITQNETSNGTQISNALIRSLKKNNPDSFIAVDATSSMAGVALDFKAADIWFASVQKCFGLPAGLGLLVCSPRAITRARALNDALHYNSLPFMLEMMDKWQTPFTPNVLNIYLLMRVVEKAPPIKTTEAKVQERFTVWEKFFSQSDKLSLLIKNLCVQLPC